MRGAMAKSAVEARESAAHAAAASYSPSYRYYVLVVLFLGYVVNVMDRGMLAALLESIRKEFSLSDTAGGAPERAALRVVLFDARHSHRGARRPLHPQERARGLLCALERGDRGVWHGRRTSCSLIGARALTAVGEAGGTPPSHSLISDYFSARHARHGAVVLRARCARRADARAMRSAVAETICSAGAPRSCSSARPESSWRC